MRHSNSEEGEAEKLIALREMHSCAAYVLLGDAGLGKSKAFEQEAEFCGGRLINAGDFLALDYPELKDCDRPIFIDGLDETRAGAMDDRVPLDVIRNKLQRLGCRSFRISCRAADWLGASDVRRLQSLLPPHEIVQVCTLQPLSLPDVAVILQANHGIADAKAFVAAADLHGLRDLLTNPQTLQMLAKAVGSDNRWPGSRLEVYEMACARLVHEHNQEHVAATRKAASHQALIRQAAAYLCALQLIADLAGYTYASNPTGRVLPLSAVPNPDQLPLDEAIASRLFKQTGRAIFAPAHRTVAEFLAASYVATGLRAKLSLRRVLALICGADGGIVSGMRGLTAWLASLSADARSVCRRLDPIGVLLYGDASHFSVAEKLALIEAMSGGFASSLHFLKYGRGREALSTLITPHFLEAVASRLESRERSEKSQRVALILLYGLPQAPPAPPLAPVILAMVRDDTWARDLRVQALDTYLEWNGANHVDVQMLLDDIHLGIVTDTGNQLMNTLLFAMYPHALPPRAIAKLFPRSRNLATFPFWRNLRRVNVNELPELLDAFAQSPDLRLRRAEETRGYARILGALLVRALNELADTVPYERVLDWLDTCCGYSGTSLLIGDDVQAVRDWIEARPQRFYSLLDLALARYWTQKGRIWAAEGRLHGAKEPLDSSAWWLARAEVTSDEGRAKDYFVRAFHAASDEHDLNRDSMLHECTRVANSKGWRQAPSGMHGCDYFGNRDWRWGFFVLEQGWQREAARWLNSVRKRSAEFALDMVPLDILGRITHAYVTPVPRGCAPKESLRKLFAGDEELTQAAIQALKNTIRRDDLPTIAQTLKAAEMGAELPLNTSALVGLDLCYLDDPAVIDMVSGEWLVAALVAHFAELLPNSWVDAVIRSRPQIVAEAMTCYMTAALRWRQQRPTAAHLLGSAAYRPVAEQCLLPLLARFPLRAHRDIRVTLVQMLHAALGLPDREKLASMIKARIETGRMDGPQRACWLAAGLLLDDGQYEALVTGYIQRRPPSAAHIVEFLAAQTMREPRATLTANVLGSLIEHFAIGGVPRQDAGISRVPMNAVRYRELLQANISALASRSDAASVAQLQRLEATAEMSDWAGFLRDARLQQEVVRRDSTFRHPEWAQVCAALRQDAPVRLPDIAAVINDTIQDLAEQIRYSDLNLNDQYWNTDVYARATSPRHEEVCRNAFGDQLRVRLARFGIGCLPEVHHVDGKRSDLWCTTALVGVPIEIKKDHHPALWTAPRGQLIARYTNDPRAKGLGIYVVFWFGQPSNVPAPPSGVRPTTPQKLEAMLQANLDEAERRSITVHVIDCSTRRGKP